MPSGGDVLVGVYDTAITRCFKRKKWRELMRLYDACQNINMERGAYVKKHKKLYDTAMQLSSVHGHILSVD